jgi:adenine-specific DNA-methyltransferase
MPTLQFKGRNIIWNHHLSVPYHTLEEVKELNVNPDKANGNILIEGDNLTALKALLPFYSNRIKMIYIDPPYNTGKQKWIYNDNVNHPMIMEWIGKEVIEDDLTRHDKWLCMITPRLKIMRDLLSEEGLIFISIDDHEYNN